MGSMRKVFIAGSRSGTSFGRLDAAVLDELERLASDDVRVLVGDANGVDSAVQVFFANKQYCKSKIVIYAVDSGRVRNNAGAELGWPVEIVQSTETRPFERQRSKDITMANESTEGYFVFSPTYTNRFKAECVSKGTLMNMIEMTKLGKGFRVYYTPDARSYDIRGTQELEDFVKMIGIEKVDDVFKKSKNENRQIKLF